MITNNISWSLGSTPNKSLASSVPSIPIHSPSDPTQLKDSRETFRSILPPSVSFRSFRSLPSLALVLTPNLRNPL